MLCQLTDGAAKRLGLVVLVFALLGAACSGEGYSQEELDAAVGQAVDEAIAEALATTSTTAVTTTTSATTTTLAPTTTVETLNEAAGVWCELNPWAFVQTGASLDFIDEDRELDVRIAGTSYFWITDGYDLFAGKSKFDSLPNDWYEYPGASGALQREVEVLRIEMGEQEFAHVCNLAYETR